MDSLVCEHHQSVIFFRLPVPARLDRRSWFPIVSNNQRAAVFLEDLWFHQETDGTDSVCLCSHIKTSFKACFNNGPIMSLSTRAWIGSHDALGRG